MTTQVDSIREMKRRKPFVPFRIIAVSGERYTVEDWFQFAVDKGRIMYVYPASDRFVQLREEQIAGIELVEKKPAA